MRSMRPYLLRALYEWISNSECTPYLVVDANFPGVVVPRDKVAKDGQIVLNIAERAVEGLDVTRIKRAIYFTAYFGGELIDIVVPMGAMVAIYAKENGAGMSFPPEDPDTIDDPPELEMVSSAPVSHLKSHSKKTDRSHLTVVKTNKADKTEDD